MENLNGFTLSPLQTLLVLALQIWLYIIFPIIIIRKVDYIIAMFHDQFYSNKDT